MRRIILMLLATVLISSCAGRPSKSGSFSALGECDDKGGTFVILHYGNAEIRVTARAKVAAGEIFAIRLKPDQTKYDPKDIDFKAQKVTITPKTGSGTWLAASKSYNETDAPHHELIMCAPKTETSGTEHFYNIVIDKVGSIDPRVDIN